MEDRNENARKQALAQLESVKAMVAAIGLDWNRYEELKEERETLAQDLEDTAGTMEHADAIGALAEWDRENGEEFQDLKEAAGEYEDEDAARQAIQEDPLSVEVRSGWYTPGSEAEPEEFKILLCTGGPAVQIRGELDQYRQPSRAWIEFQDWFTSWEELVEPGSTETLLTYCQEFYFGE